MRYKSLIFASLLAAVGVPAIACSHTYEAGGDIAPATSIGLRVVNDNFLDMDVYAVTSGIATRVGTVTGNNNREFTISAANANRDLRIIATPIGGPGRASTGSLTVVPGQTIEFRVGSVLSQSTVFIR